MLVALLGFVFFFGQFISFFFYNIQSKILWPNYTAPVKKMSFHQIYTNPFHSITKRDLING